MGTTLTAAALVNASADPKVALINVGDSRAYLYSGGRLTRLTEDHSLVEEMVRRGELSEDDALTHPHRHILTRVIGVEPDIDVDAWTIEVRDGDRLLLCSDGLTNECKDPEIAQLLRDHADPEQAVHALVDRALRNGGSDNVTVVVSNVIVTNGAGGMSTGRAGGHGATRDPAHADSARTSRHTVLCVIRDGVFCDPCHRGGVHRLVRQGVVLRRLQQRERRDLRGPSRRIPVVQTDRETEDVLS